MEIKKLFVIAIFIIAASFLGLSCQKEEPEQEQASVKHLEGEESAQQQPLQAQQAPAQPLQYEDKEEDEDLADEDKEEDEDLADENKEDDENDDIEDNGNGFAYIQSDLQDIIDKNPGTELATRMQEVMIKVSEANSKRTASQSGAAVSELQAAIGVLESAITEGLINSVEGQEIIDDLTDEIQELNSTP